MTDRRPCGNCQTPVDADATFCPACGALLSAYESPAGAIATPDLSIAPAPTTSAPTMTTSTTLAPSTVTPAPWAIRTTTTPRPSIYATTTGASDTILPDPASDDLAAMARTDSDFAARIEADLAEAKVVFDDRAGAVIETAPTAPDLAVGTGEPATTTPHPGARTTTTRPPRTTTTRAPRTTTTRTPRTTTTRAPRPGDRPIATAHRPEYLDPNRKLDPPKPPAQESWRRTPARSGTDAKRPFLQSKMLIPAIIAGLIIINFAVRNPAFGSFLVIAAILVYILMRGAIGASKSNGRTTTRMPRDDKKNRR